MNATARAKIDSIEHKRAVFRAVMSYFGEFDDPQMIERVSAAVDSAYTDDLLFEDFEIWVEERNDQAFLYQVDHFLETRGTPPLARADLTGRPAEIEKVQADAEEDLARTFAAKLRLLANQRGLKTNKDIGDFLEKNQEQVRVMLAAEHKPQRKTLLLVAEKFGISVESLIAD
jgi:hypothetical protein